MEKNAAALLRKTASVLERVKAELQTEREKTANAEDALLCMQKNQQRLFKLAAKETIRYEDVPGMLHELTDLSKNQQEVELLSLEKAASLNFLRVGDIEKTASTSDDSDALTSFILMQ